jgi:DNA-binding response OmpR family regulator
MTEKMTYQKTPADLTGEERPSHILVVDDDPNTLELLRIKLHRSGYRVSSAPNGSQALTCINQDPPDLILLDLIMPGMSGIQACRIIRVQTSLPIIMISACDSREKMIEALQEGADDFLTKPFSLHELTARIRAVLRRSRQPHHPESICVCVGELKADFFSGSIFYRDSSLDFTPTENDLMLELLLYPNQVIPHERLLEHVWGEAYQDSVEYLHMYIGRLRKKIQHVPEVSIQSISGTGYLLQT